VPKRLTAIEILEADHPGILLAAKHALDQGKSSQFTSTFLTDTFHVSITKSSLEKYRRKRWLTERNDLAKQKRDFQLAASQLGKNGLTQAASALLFEHVRELSPANLIAILRVDLQNKTFKMRAKALQTISSQDKTEKEKFLKASPEEQIRMGKEAANHMREIFGLCTVEEERELHTKYPQGIPVHLAHGVSTTLTPTNGVLAPETSEAKS